MESQLRCSGNGGVLSIVLIVLGLFHVILQHGLVGVRSDSIEVTESKDLRLGITGTVSVAAEAVDSERGTEPTGLIWSSR